MQDYMEKAMRTCSPGYHKDLVNTDLLHGAIGAVTEAAELLDAVKKALFYGKPIDETNIIEEIGDILWYIQPMLKILGVTEDEVKARNIAKLSKRYPEKFTQEKAENRDLAAEGEALKAEPKIDPDMKRQMDALKIASANASRRGGKDDEESTY